MTGDNLSYQKESAPWTMVGRCGHEITQGDTIGMRPESQGVVHRICAKCFANLWRQKHRGSPDICVGSPDRLYPSHDYTFLPKDQPDGAEWECKACGIRALDIDVDGVTLVPCEHGEQPGYCDCGWEAGQR